jgi:putative FmdB family regulatory protein
MPTYSYICNSCNHSFELFSYIKDYNAHPKCPSCNKSKTDRDYENDLLTINSSIVKHDSELKTIGDLANRNRDRMSDDQKNELSKKHNDYKDEQSQKPLPKGMSRINKPKKIKWR